MEIGILNKAALGLVAAVVLLGVGFAWGVAAKTFGWPPVAQLRRLMGSGLAQELLDDPESPPDKAWRDLDGVEQRLSDGGDAEELGVLGYASGYERAPGFRGVVFYDPERAMPGVNLVVSAHALEIALMDMQGEIVHRWRLDGIPAFETDEVTSGAESLDRVWDCSRYRFFRRARVLSDGRLLAILECGGLVALDRESRLLFATERTAHHDLDLTDDGTIWVLTRRARVNESVHGWRPILEDFAVELDQNGHRLREVSLLSAMQQSRFSSSLSKMPAYGDVTHVNTLEWLDGRRASSHPAFARGNLLISLRQIDAIAIVDPVHSKVVWTEAGFFEAQHQPTLLESGNVLLFDNRGHGDFSKVIEFDPKTKEPVWSYEGNDKNGFFSDTSGSAARLENGNTLITESNSGRAFEVDREGRIVWEFFNPERSGDQDELIATLFEVERLPLEAVSWLLRDE